MTALTAPPTPGPAVSGPAPVAPEPPNPAVQEHAATADLAPAPALEAADQMEADLGAISGEIG